MRETAHEAQQQQHLLLMVDSALRAGRSEQEIAKIVTEAVAPDDGAERIDRAA